jgi:hypothetical protein
MTLEKKILVLLLEKLLGETIKDKDIKNEKSAFNIL